MPPKRADGGDCAAKHRAEAGYALVGNPRAVAVVNAQQIEERGAKKIDQALRYSAGVLATPYGPDNKTEWLVIRGFSDLSRFQNGLATLNEDGFIPSSWNRSAWSVLRY